MKNVLIIIPTLAYGGMERIASDTASVLGEKNNTFVVVYTNENKGYKPNCKVINLRLQSKKNIFKNIPVQYRRYKEIKNIKKKYQIDVTYSFGVSANMMNSLTKGKDRIFTSIRGYLSLPKTKMEKLRDFFVFWKSDVVIVVSKQIRDELSKIYPSLQEKIKVLYNPCDFEKIDECKMKYIDLELTYPVIVSMGRLHKVKGFKHLLGAFKKVLKNFPEATLLIVGGGEYFSELNSKIHVLGIEERVVFTGYVDNPYKYLSNGDIYALCSTNEGFPNALIEAMYCGLPVVAADCKSGPREILNEEYDSNLSISTIHYCDYGILYPPFHSDDSIESDKEKLLADAMISLLSDKYKLNYYSNKSIQRALRFSKGYYLENLFKIFDGLD